MNNPSLLFDIDGFKREFFVFSAIQIQDHRTLILVDNKMDIANPVDVIIAEHFGDRISPVSDSTLRQLAFDAFVVQSQSLGLVTDCGFQLIVAWINACISAAGMI